MSNQDIHGIAAPRGMLGLSRRAALGLLVAAALAAAPGCAWKPDILVSDPSLTGRSLAEGKLVILPVKFDTEKVARPERYNVWVNLGYSISHVRADLPVVFGTVVKKAIEGSPQEEELVMSVYREGGADPEALKALEQATGGRYMILSRLHYEQRPVSGLAPENSGLAPERGQDVVESTLSGSVAIVDSRSAQVVWEGKFSSTKSGVDTLLAPKPSVHAQQFFSTIVDSWPK